MSEVKVAIKADLLFETLGVNELSAISNTLNLSSMPVKSALVKQGEENDNVHILKEHDG